MNLIYNYLKEKYVYLKYNLNIGIIFFSGVDKFEKLRISK